MKVGLTGFKHVFAFLYKEQETEEQHTIKPERKPCPEEVDLSDSQDGSEYMEVKSTLSKVDTFRDRPRLSILERCLAYRKYSRRGNVT